jgi:hypothetical protein
MGFFAILAPPEAEPDTLPTIRKCHINLWSRGTLLRHRVVCDVGLDIHAPAAATVRSVTLALPFRIREGDVTDLYSKLTNPDGARLIFGEQITSTHQTIVGSDDHLYNLRRVSTENMVSDAAWSARDLSVVRLSLREPLPAKQFAYVRMRFGIASLGRTWSWKRSGWTMNGALVDFRIADVREAVGRTTREGLEHRVLPLKDVRLLIMLPWHFQMRFVSPPLRYARLMEDEAWADYLEGWTLRPRRAKLVIYYWRWPALDANPSPVEIGKDDNEEKNKGEAKPVIDVRNPARAFLDVSRDYGALSWGNYLRIGIVVFLVDVVVQFLLSRVGTVNVQLTLPTRWPPWIVASFGIVTALAAGIGIFRSLAWLIDRLRSTAKSVRQHYGVD